MSVKKQGLGRGLSALLASSPEDVRAVNKQQKNDDATVDVGMNEVTGVIGAIASIPLKQIEVNPLQPRTVFSQEALDELAASIKVSGIIQPITVRKMGDKYQLISGERRFRASHLAGLQEVPAYIRMVNDNELLEMALVENIQRENLNAIDVALSFQALLDACQINQEKLSDRVGKSRSTVTNFLRLLKLPAEAQLALRDDKISMGHAKAIITVEDPEKQISIVRQIIDKSLSVRQVEDLVRQKTEDSKPKKQKTIEQVPAWFIEKQAFVSEKIAAPVSMSRSKNGKGSLSIAFTSEQDLKRIMDLLSCENNFIK